MNKQEAIEKVKEHGEFYSNAFGGTVNMVPVGPIIDIISQIDEPKKGAIHIIKAPYKNEAVWKYDEEETDEKY